MPWAPDYITTADLAAYLRIDDTIDDTQLGLAIAAASRAIDHQTKRQFGNVAVAEERRYDADFNRRRGRWEVEIDDLMDDIGLTVAVDAGTVDVFALEPVNAAVESRPWTRIVISPDAANLPSSFHEPEVAVTALWGWTEVPDTVKQATTLQASRFFSRRTSPYGVAGSPETGSELRLLSRVDADVAVALKDYVRQRVAVG